MNTLDSISHTYKIDDRPVVSVTQVLRDVLPGFSASEWYLERGTAVHASMALIARQIDFEYDPIIEPQILAGRKFFDEIKPKVISVEQPVYSRQYLYAGRLDLIVEINKKIMILDWKATLSPEIKYQLAGYAIPTNIQYGVGVQINDDGTYKMGEIYDLKRAKNEWLSLLTAFRIRRQCKIKEEVNE